jgi:hypothetical protein
MADWNNFAFILGCIKEIMFGTIIAKEQRIGCIEET